MSGHTPGPWFAQPDFLTIYNMSGGDTGLTCAVAKAFTEQPGKSAAEANARLIAAAPELLEALRDVIGWIPDGGAWHTKAPMESVAKARAAIAKATAA